MDKAQAMGNKAAEESDRPLEEFQNLKNDFSLNARKKGQLVPNVHENFEQSKLTAMEVSKSLSHWKENARGSREYISEQTSSFIGASKDTKPGIETRQHAGQNIKTEAQALVNL